VVVSIAHKELGRVWVKEEIAGPFEACSRARAHYIGLNATFSGQGAHKQGLGARGGKVTRGEGGAGGSARGGGLRGRGTGGNTRK